MRSILVAAAVALPTAAFAQSSVTVYGMIDASVINLRYSDTAARAGSNLTLLASDASRLGFRGSEDLGGGLRAYFKLEHGLQIDTGLATSATTFFSREAYVGLGDNKLGSLQLGSQYTPNVWTSIKADPFTRFGVGGQATLTQGLRGYPLIYNNAAQYISPTVGGFSGRLMVSAGEGAITGRSISGAVEYGQGDLYIGLVVDDLRTTPVSVGLTGTNPVSSRTIALAATYKLPVLKLHGWAQTNRISRLDDVNAYMAGVSVPVGDLGEVRATYTRRSGPNASGATLAAIGYSYQMSKRTSLYANVAKLTNQRTGAFRMGPAFGEQAGLGLPVADQDTSGVQLGMRHWF